MLASHREHYSRRRWGEPPRLDDEVARRWNLSQFR